MSVFLKFSVIVAVSWIYQDILHLRAAKYNLEFNCFWYILFVGMTGVVDYTNYDDMKYAVS